MEELLKHPLVSLLISNAPVILAALVSIFGAGAAGGWFAFSRKMRNKAAQTPSGLDDMLVNAILGPFDRIAEDLRDGVIDDHPHIISAKIKSASEEAKKIGLGAKKS